VFLALRSFFPVLHFSYSIHQILYCVFRKKRPGTQYNQIAMAVRMPSLIWTVILHDLRSSNNTMPTANRKRQNNTTIMNNNFSKEAKKT